MKKAILVILCFLAGFSYAQEVNKLDADGKRHGIWRKNFEKTKVLRYEGEFFHGKEIGLFKFYKNINKRAVLTATKQFNKENDIADVKFYTSSGKVLSEGQMKARIYIGEWKYYHKNSKQLMILEHFNVQGNLQGERLVYYKNGVISQKEYYKNGKLDGLSISYLESGVVIKEFAYVNGILHGLSKFYNADGKLITEGHYKNDKKHGIWKYYNNGRLVKKKDFTRYSKNPYKKKN